MRCLRTALLLAVAWLMSAAPARAECVSLPREWIEHAAYEIVFEGSVQALQMMEHPLAYIATMQVHRVWKGTLPSQIELYAWGSSAHVQLQIGHRYVLAIQRMRPPDVPEQRPDLVYGTMPCAGAERDSLLRMGELDRLGAGRPPGR